MPVTVDDAAVFMAEFTSGVVGTFEVGRHASGRKNQLGFELYCSEGSVVFDWEQRDQIQVSFRDDPPEMSGLRNVLMGPAHPFGVWPIPAIGYGYVESLVVEVEEFVRAVAEHRQATPSFEVGLRVQRVLEAVERSAAQGTWTDVFGTATGSSVEAVCP